ncbi:MAG: NTP transferase domain-containing protein, partial [Pseudohongiellaceae bacterium]
MQQRDENNTFSMETPTTTSRTVGVILAGGRSRRMRASKPEQILAGRSLLE